MIVLPLLVACGTSLDQEVRPVKEGVTDPATETTPDPVPDPYVAEDDPVNPALSLEQVAVAVTDAIGTAKLVRGSLLFEGYQTSLSGRSESCPYTNPEYSEYYGIDYWYDSCTAESGTSFNGYGYGWVDEPFWSGTYLYNQYAYFYGDANITTPDGSEYVASGNASLYDYTESTYYGLHYLSFSAFGEFRWDAPEAAGTWLEGGLSTTLSIQAYDYTSGARWMLLDGGLSRLEGEINAFVFDQLNYGNTAYGLPCPDEPGGSLSVRDSTGDWYDIIFDGADYGSATVFPPECDGCGHVWFRGEQLGDVCPDLSGLSNWEGWVW